MLVSQIKKDQSHYTAQLDFLKDQLEQAKRMNNSLIEIFQKQQESQLQAQQEKKEKVSGASMEEANRIMKNCLKA